MLTLAALLLVPLAIRYVTSWHMSSLRAKLYTSDEDLRQLRERYTDLREQLIDVRRRRRLYDVRRTRLLDDIRQDRVRLEQLRAEPARDRLAA